MVYICCVFLSDHVHTHTLKESVVFHAQLLVSVYILLFHLNIWLCVFIIHCAQPCVYTNFIRLEFRQNVCMSHGYCAQSAIFLLLCIASLLCLCVHFDAATLRISTSYVLLYPRASWGYLDLTLYYHSSSVFTQFVRLSKQIWWLWIQTYSRYSYQLMCT